MPDAHARAKCLIGSKAWPGNAKRELGRVLAATGPRPVRARRKGQHKPSWSGGRRPPGVDARRAESIGLAQKERAQLVSTRCDIRHLGGPALA